MTIQAWLQIITSIITLLGVVFLVYHFFRNPDIKADKDITLMEAECELKHKRLDEINLDTKTDIKELKESVRVIKENHLHHIEQDIQGIKIVQTEILTILKERNNK